MVTVNPKAQTAMYKSQHAASMAIMATSITLVIAFVAFMIIGYGIEQTVFWMLGLGLVAFGGTYVGTYLGGGVVDTSAPAADEQAAARRPAAG